MNGGSHPNTSSVCELLRPVLDLSLAAWRGLPSWPTTDVTAAIGKPEDQRDTMLGMFPAQQQTHRLPDRPAGGLIVFSRQGQIVLIETLRPPSMETLTVLGEPDARKAHELSAPDAYVWEYVYCDRGLVLSVTEPFDETEPKRIVRCRVLPRLMHPQEYGAAFYLPLASRTAFPGQDL